MSPEQRFGITGEHWVYNQALAMGLDVQIVNDFFAESHDLTINGLPVEVKIANKSRRPRTLASGKVKWYARWQWHISPTIEKHKGDFALVLVAKDHSQHFPFVLPGSAVNDRPHLQITSHPLLYSGWLSQWLNRWEIIPYLANGTYRNNGPLFHKWLHNSQAAA